MKKILLVLSLIAAVPPAYAQIVDRGAESFARLDSFHAIPVKRQVSPKVEVVASLDSILIAQGISLPSEVSPYEKIKALFDAAKGQLPSKEELTGQYIGRGFTRKYGQYRAIKAVLAGAYVDEVKDGGPLFKKVFRVAFILGVSAPVDVVSLTTNHSNPTFGSDGIEFMNIISRDYVYELRKSGPYLIVKARLLQNPDSNEVVDEGYAYFYEKL